MITEKFSGHITEPGSFDLTLDPSLSPFDSALEQIEPFDVIVILPGWIQHPDEFLDADLLAIARYAGPIIEIEHSQDEIHLIGQGMSWYLGDSSGLGPMVNDPISFTAALPSGVIDVSPGLLGPSGIAPILPGTITDTGSLDYTVVDGHYRETHRQALDIYLKARAVEARVNPNGTIDATSRGRDEVFIISTPKIFASRDGWGQDPGEFIGVECNRMLVRKDATNWASGAEFVDMETATELSSNDSSLAYLNIHGTNLIHKLTVTSIPESLADPGQQEALTYLDSELRLRDRFIEVEIDTNMLEMSLGNMNVGDWIWLESVEDGLIGTGVARPFRGSMRIPLKARIFEGTWPTLDGMGFYHRRSDQDPETVADRWTDLTPIVVKEYREGQSFSRLVVKLTPPSPPPWPT